MDDHLIPVEGHKNLYRDENSGAIINTDVSEYNNYIRLKNKKQKQQDQISELKQEVSDLKKLLFDALGELKKEKKS